MRTKPQPTAPGGWTRWAQCRIQGIDMAEPEECMPARRKKIIARKKAACDVCAVDGECLAWALTRPDPAIGCIAGGMTTKERDAERKKR